MSVLEVSCVCEYTQCRQDMERLVRFRSRVLDAFAAGMLHCDCEGICHEAHCPLGELEVEAEMLRELREGGEQRSEKSPIKPWLPQDKHLCGHGVLIRTDMTVWTCFDCRATFRHTWLSRPGHSHVRIEAAE